MGFRHSTLSDHAVGHQSSEPTLLGAAALSWLSAAVTRLLSPGDDVEAQSRIPEPLLGNVTEAELHTGKRGPPHWTLGCEEKLSQSPSQQLPVAMGLLPSPELSARGAALSPSHSRDPAAWLPQHAPEGRAAGHSPSKCHRKLCDNELVLPTGTAQRPPTSQKDDYIC